MTEAKVATKEFTFHTAQSEEPTIELIQLMSLSIQSCDSSSLEPCDIPSVIKYFASLYGVKL